MSDAAQSKIAVASRHAEIVTSSFRLKQQSPRWVETNETLCISHVGEVWPIMHSESLW